MKNIIIIFALLLIGCTGKRPDICQKQRIACINECNDTICIGKCEERYQNCIKSESMDNIGSFIYNVNYFNKKE